MIESGDPAHQVFGIGNILLYWGVALYNFVHCGTGRRGCAGVSSTTASAQVWAELGDAGDLTTNAQTPAGVGPLTQITGLSDSTIQDKDVYRIRIEAGGGFSATVTSMTPSDDTKMYLFNAAGMGIIGDDDSSVPAPFGSAFPLGNLLIASLPAGVYYLAITDYNFLPTSAGGEIFPSGNVVGPTGPGGGQPFTGWNTDFHESSYSYVIALTGASFVPEPSTLAGIVALAAGFGFRRYR